MVLPVCISKIISQSMISAHWDIKFLTLEDGTEKLSRNVGKESPL